MSNFKLNGSECLGIEFGSTRIKAILIDDEFNVLATGSYCLLYTSDAADD